ncbi:hypothetical protein Salat_2894800 [Sesamum alatum]|uniref:Uncharacterized protein n=1 Tax=Sesamum alatum TaxID=300844 RepID=A0AAE1XIB5_9LAMI|nr:hypothetical protein Salat_2894800 [Sesamum alatum]
MGHLKFLGLIDGRSMEPRPSSSYLTCTVFARKSSYCFRPLVIVRCSNGGADTESPTITDSNLVAKPSLSMSSHLATDAHPEGCSELCGKLWGWIRPRLFER